MKQRGTVAPNTHVTMKNIADEAGVTLATVSRILNNQGEKYAEQTKLKIIEIADRLKYRPNGLVRGMQTGKTGIAGVMVPLGDYFHAMIVAGIHETLLDNDTIMLLSWNSRTLNQKNVDLERQIIHRMIDRRVDGILLRPSSEGFERQYFEEIWERNIPLILIDREMSNLETDFVGSDDRRGGQMAAEYLLGLGHRRMGFVGVSTLVSTSRHREDGFRDVLHQTPGTTCITVDILQQSDLQKLRDLLSMRNRPTALFCYHDPLANTVADLASSLGLAIPRDISVVGFGNVPTQNDGVALTTFEQHPQRIGAAAARLYLDRIKGHQEREFQREIIPADLVVRGSARAIAAASV